MSEAPDFLTALEKLWPETTEEQRELLLQHFEAILAENEVQNLTRILNPLDFVESQLEDVRALLSTGWLEGGISLDLGSGAGIPGIPAAIVGGEKWVLAESEGKKAEFLDRTVAELELSERVKVFPGRAEALLSDRQLKAGAIVAKAVGPVDRIFAWIEPCSTWNELILMKGPRWEEEWEEFRKSRWRKSLEVVAIHPYEVGLHEKKQRKLIRLRRVPRGTSKNSSK